MKQSIQLSSQQLSLPILKFLTIWLERKGYPLYEIQIGHCIEALIAFSYNYRYEDSDSRFFNNLLANRESSISWDGDSLIDILFYEVLASIKKRLNQGRTFNDVDSMLE